MAALGDIVTRMTVDKRDFQTGLMGAGRDAEKFGKQASNALGKNRGGLTFAMLELSRGAEDAAVSFGTGGLAGAIRGGANNLAAFATIINPMAGVVVGLGAALASVLVPRLLDTGDAAEEAKKKVQDFASAWAGLDVWAQSLGRRSGGATMGDTLVTAVQAQAAVRQAALARDDARSHRLLAEQRLIATDTPFGQPFGQEFANRIMETDPRSGGSALRQLEKDLVARGGNLPENWSESRQRLLSAEKALQEARLAEMDAVDSQRDAIRNLADARKREAADARRASAADAAARLFGAVSERNAGMLAVQDQLTRQGIAASLGGRRTILDRQRQMLGMVGSSFRSPELTTRGNAVDRIVEIAQAKREAKEETFRKTAIERLDSQIERLDKLIEEVRSGDGLKPAGVG